MAKLKLNYGLLIQAVRNDFCLLETCLRMIDEGIEDIFFSVPRLYWNRVPVEQAGIDQVWQVKEAISSRVRCHWRFFDVAKKSTFVESETLLRNQALDWVFGQVEHVILADADELWISGRLKRLDDIISEYKPSAVSLGMIPTLGIPGLPVERATDRATVYFHRDKRISWCRGYEPDGRDITLMDPRGLYHFSSTRRTLEELVDKCRKSGHYDDAQYEFERWLTEIVPHVRPGMKWVHMYHLGREGNIWPEVRSWTAQELSDIPASLHPFLKI